ncbi:hypothetical protein KEF29_29595 [Streptomyces tuirus]|uniref:Uncharacterized protein n=1 Tax=Streptomyces tuirus TaxID=68278 RepID=A0A941FG25_9ACTN|nr:hypothetical protein [Streptomyces tuirus]
MPDDIFGDALPQSDRPSRKRQLTDKDQRSRDDRIGDCLDYPLIYELAELLPPPAPSAARADTHPSRTS